MANMTRSEVAEKLASIGKTIVLGAGLGGVALLGATHYKAYKKGKKKAKEDIREALTLVEEKK